MTIRRSVGSRPGDLALLLEVGEEVAGGEIVEVVGGLEPGQGARPPRLAVPEVGLGLADEGPDRPAELDRTADRVALPERQLAGYAGRRLDDHPVGRDVQDSPAAGAKDDDVAMHPGPKLVDHLLVELADPPARRPGLTGDEDAEQAPVRDRPAGGDGDDTGIAPTFDHVRDPVPDDARLELRELVGRIGAGEHPQDGLERLPRQRLERRGPGHGGEEVRDGPRLEDGHRDQLLGEDIERVARHDGRLDGALVHPAHDDGRLEEVAAELREHARPSMARRRGDRPVRRAGARRRRSSATRRGSRDRPRPCRCRARGCSWRRAPAGGRP